MRSEPTIAEMRDMSDDESTGDTVSALGVSLPWPGTEPGGLWAECLGRVADATFAFGHSTEGCF